MTGSIPTQFGNLANLQRLELQYNQLSGSIPTQIGNLANLTTFYAYRNQLTGSIPAAIGNLGNLVALELTNNQLSGPVPPELGNLANLQALRIGDNQFTGTIPAALAGLVKAWTIELSNNLLTGTIPPALATMPQLGSLYLTATASTARFPWSSAMRRSWCRCIWREQDRRRRAGNDQNLALIRAIPTCATTGSMPPTRRSRHFSPASRRIGKLQTGPVANLAAPSATTTSVTLTWMPILYTGDIGGYRVDHATTLGGPYTLFGTTTDKSATGAVVTGLVLATPYHFVVHSVTDANPNNQNVIVNDPSAETSRATTSGVATPAILTATPLPTGVVGIAYDQTFSATGGMPPYTNGQLTAERCRPG